MKVGIIMGSKTDYVTVQKAEAILKRFNVNYETRILSAHRTPHALAKFAEEAEGNGIEVIIAAAGKAAHLAGMVAALTPLPVIGIPIKSSALDGLDALLSTVQMPSGVPVATVGIDAAENAALLALQILGIKHDKLQEELKAYKNRQESELLRLDEEMQQS